MKGVLEMSLLIGLILLPIVTARYSPVTMFRSILAFCVGYYALALFILPRLPG